jgi:hypothetical protein
MKKLIASTVAALLASATFVGVAKADDVGVVKFDGAIKPLCKINKITDGKLGASSDNKTLSSSTAPGAKGAVDLTCNCSGTLSAKFKSLTAKTPAVGSTPGLDFTKDQLAALTSSWSLDGNPLRSSGTDTYAVAGDIVVPVNGQVKKTDGSALSIGNYTLAVDITLTGM